MNIEDINTLWIEEQMKELGIKRKNLTKDLLLDRSYLSRLFSSDDKPHKIQLTKQTKALFYYYFLTHRLKKGM